MVSYKYNGVTGKLDLVSVPGGNDTNIQFNDGGAFGGNEAFKLNATTVSLLGKQFFMAEDVDYNTGTKSVGSFDSDNFAFIKLEEGIKTHDWQFKYDTTTEDITLENSNWPVGSQEFIIKGHTKAWGDLGFGEYVAGTPFYHITNMKDPTANQDAATKKYHDDNLSSLLPTLYAASLASGDDGDQNRTLTHTSEVSMIFIDTFAGQPTVDYSVTGTTITFLNNIFNQQTITIWSLE